VYYDRLRSKGIEQADIFLELVHFSPIKIVDMVSMPVIHEVARFKTSYKVSLADSFALATASCLSGTLVTSDHHELEQVEQQESIPFLWIR
jgi:predicted nucleic acid-binding protein